MSGYPNKLKGDEIILEAKIIGVADVVEAILKNDYSKRTCFSVYIPRKDEKDIYFRKTKKYDEDLNFEKIFFSKDMIEKYKSIE